MRKGSDLVKKCVDVSYRIGTRTLNASSKGNTKGANTKMKHEAPRKEGNLSSTVVRET